MNGAEPFDFRDHLGKSGHDPTPPAKDKLMVGVAWARKGLVAIALPPKAALGMRIRFSKILCGNTDSDQERTAAVIRHYAKEFQGAEVCFMGTGPADEGARVPAMEELERAFPDRVGFVDSETVEAWASLTMPLVVFPDLPERYRWCAGPLHRAAEAVLFVGHRVAREFNKRAAEEGSRDE